MRQISAFTAFPCAVAFAGLSGLLFSSIEAQAAVVQVRDGIGGESANGNSGGFYLTGTGSRPHVSIDGGAIHSGYSGVFDFEIDRHDGEGWSSFFAFCIQPEVSLPFGRRSVDQIGAMYETVDLEGHNRFTAERAQWTRILWAHAFEDSKLSQTQAAAFQLLLWEFVTDETPDLLNGDFRLDPSDSFTADVLSIANIWLDNILSGSWTQKANLIALSNPDGQDLIMQIPAPSALVGLAMLLVGSRRRR